jgi:probable HAF family extracellular repeat protein
MPFATALSRCIGAVLERTRTGRLWRPHPSRGRPRSTPCPERLEDRRLLSYTITNLGSLGGTVSVPVALNDRGEVVGFSYTPNNEAARAFLYRKGRMTDLGTLGGAYSIAMSINDRGEIVGRSSVAPGSDQIDAFLDRGGKLIDLGPLSQTFVESGTVSINDAGAIAGLSGSGFDAFVHSGRTITDIGSLAGLGSVARDINNHGQVVGFAPTSFQPPTSSTSPPTVIYHAFVDDRGAMNDLGTLGGMDSGATFINDRGAVVGFSYTANDAAIHAFLDTWGRMTDLGTLGGRDSVANAINDEGAVVGAAQTSALAQHGFIDRHGRMIDLNSLIPAESGIVITDAQDINDRGAIVADGYATNSPDVVLALLLKPTRPAR